MQYIIFRENNRFHISNVEEWNQYLSRYKRSLSILQSARRCNLNESLIKMIQHSTSQLVQRWLREYWSDGECIYS